ncbi:MAG: putative MAPEG superfamily protein [Bradymonadia bacterium]|jgi:uncharacterized MAPEG superfamily protein
MLAHTVLGTDPELIVALTMIYLIARLAHYIVYTAKIPYARTATFAVGWAVTIYLAVLLLGTV